MKCTICEEELNEEEIDAPYKNRDGDIICDACFKDRYTHTCPLCEEHFDVDFTKHISPTYLLISDYSAEYVGSPSGVYEIIRYPFYYAGMCDIFMKAASLKRIADLPDDFREQDFYSDIFYVCNRCAEKLTDDVVGSVKYDGE